MKRFWSNWLERHQHPTSYALHMVGIPMTFVAIGVLIHGWVWGERWEWVALALFLAGYGLQFIGHFLEGNDAGEVILIKKLFGLPYIDIVPREKKE